MKDLYSKVKNGLEDRTSWSEAFWWLGGAAAKCRKVVSWDGKEGESKRMGCCTASGMFAAALLLALGLRFEAADSVVASAGSRAETLAQKKFILECAEILHSLMSSLAMRG